MPSQPNCRMMGSAYGAGVPDAAGVLGRGLNVVQEEHLPVHAEHGLLHLDQPLLLELVEDLVHLLLDQPRAVLDIPLPNSVAPLLLDDLVDVQLVGGELVELVGVLDLLRQRSGTTSMSSTSWPFSSTSTRSSPRIRSRSRFDRSLRSIALHLQL